MSDEKWHGTAGGRTNHDCRCRLCSDAFARHQAQMKRNRAARLEADPSVVEHGTNNTYQNWSCRCDACRAAHTDDARRRRNAS